MNIHINISVYVLVEVYSVIGACCYRGTYMSHFIEEYIIPDIVVEVYIIIGIYYS